MVHVDNQLQLSLIWKQVLEEISWRLAPQFLASGWNGKKFTENAFPMEDVQFQKSEFGKIVVDCPKPHDFNPLCSDNLTHSFDFNGSFIILCGSCPLMCSFAVYGKNFNPGRKEERTLGPDHINQHWSWGNYRIYRKN